MDTNNTRINIFKNATKSLERYSVGAEVGVWKGDFSEEILNLYPKCHIYLIDPWKSITDIPERFHSKPQNEMDEIYESVKERFSKNSNITILRDFSKSASDKFIDSYFDWIYLDGNHSYDYVKEDLYLWWEKLSNGGVLIGDDYQEGDYQVNVLDFGVVKAVNEFIKEKAGDIKEFYTDKDQFIIKKI